MAAKEEDPVMSILKLRLRKVVMPLEPFLMYVQRVLVWEKPRHSIVMLIAVNFLFWLSTSTNYKFLFLVSTTTMVLIFIDTWVNKIWPEIKVPVPEDSDAWTPVHPRLLSGPELSHSVAEILIRINNSCTGMWKMRKEKPFRFCLLLSAVFVCLAVIGHYLPGVMILYVLVMGILLWPAVEYHSLLQKFYTKLEPIFMRLDYRMKIRSWTSNKAKKKGVQNDGNEVETESDDEFAPSSDPLTIAALARAVTDSEEEPSPSPEQLTPGMLTPGLASEHGSRSDYEDEFMEGLGEFPSIHEQESLMSDEFLLRTQPPSVLESNPSSEFGSNIFDIQDEPTDDRPAGHDDTLTGENVSNIQEMDLVPSHFDDSDDSGHDEFTENLKLPATHEVLDSSGEFDPTAVTEEDSRRAEAISAAISNAMSSTVAGLQQVGGTLVTAAIQAAQDHLAQQQTRPPPLDRSESAGSDINDFEILDPGELDDYKT